MHGELLEQHPSQTAAISPIRTCATGQATASFGGDTEVALAIGADGPIDLLCPSSGSKVAARKTCTYMNRCYERSHTEAAS